MKTKVTNENKESTKRSKPKIHREILQKGGKKNERKHTNQIYNLNKIVFILDSWKEGIQSEACHHLAQVAVSILRRKRKET